MCFSEIATLNLHSLFILNCNHTKLKTLSNPRMISIETKWLFLPCTKNMVKTLQKSLFVIIIVMSMSTTEWENKVADYSKIKVHIYMAVGFVLILFFGLQLHRNLHVGYKYHVWNTYSIMFTIFKSPIIKIEKTNMMYIMTKPNC